MARFVSVLPLAVRQFVLPSSCMILIIMILSSSSSSSSSITGAGTTRVEAFTTSSSSIRTRGGSSSSSSSSTTKGGPCPSMLLVTGQHVPIVSFKRTTAGLFLSSSSSSSGDPRMDVSRMLYQDQQDAMARRAALEKEMMDVNTKELLAPSFVGGGSNKKKKTTKMNTKAGTGFGGGGGGGATRTKTKTKTTTGASTRTTSQKRKALLNTPLQRMAIPQARVVREQGVLRIDQAMSTKCADALRSYVLQEQQQAYALADEQPSLARSLFGVENFRKHRCDLQLSLLRSQNNHEHEKDASSSSSLQQQQQQQQQQHPVADALEEVLGQDGTLRYIYEELVTMEGEFYELAAVITNPGSDRQQVHPDLPFTKEAPLYVIFLALQDITMEMGPTSFLLETHTEEAIQLFNNQGNGNENGGSADHPVNNSKDALLRSSDCVVSTLKKGDAVLFDARILHCGNANECPKLTTRALFNFSFRNPQVRGSLGYAGSIRPRYEKQMTLADVTTCLDHYRNGNPEPFAIYGDGLK